MWTVQAALVGKVIVSVVETDEWLVIRTDDGWEVHILDGGKVIVHPNPN